MTDSGRRRLPTGWPPVRHRAADVHAEDGFETAEKETTETVSAMLSRPERAPEVQNRPGTKPSQDSTRSKDLEGFCRI